MTKALYKYEYLEYPDKTFLFCFLTTQGDCGIYREAILIITTAFDFVQKYENLAVLFGRKFLSGAMRSFGCLMTCLSDSLKWSMLGQKCVFEVFANKNPHQSAKPRNLIRTFVTRFYNFHWFCKETVNALMRRLIWALAVRTCSKDTLSNVAAQI